jgi:hypothetical protein
MEHLVMDRGRPTKIIHGNARGADTMAADWATQMAIEVQSFPADWAAHGVFAGPHRNQQMLDDGKPELVVAFPTRKSTGTWDMVRKAKKAGVETMTYQAP